MNKKNSFFFLCFITYFFKRRRDSKACFRTKKTTPCDIHIRNQHQILSIVDILEYLISKENFLVIDPLPGGLRGPHQVKKFFLTLFHYHYFWSSAICSVIPFGRQVINWSVSSTEFSSCFVDWGRGGAVVRALAFYTDAPSSIPGKGKNQIIGRSPVDPAVNGYLVL